MRCVYILCACLSCACFAERRTITLPETVAVSFDDGKRLLVIGGYDAEGILSDVWEFHLGYLEWTRVNVVAGLAPPERAYFRGDFLDTCQAFALPIKSALRLFY